MGERDQLVGALGGLDRRRSARRRRRRPSGRRRRPPWRRPAATSARRRERAPSGRLAPSRSRRPCVARPAESRCVSEAPSIGGHGSGAGLQERGPQADAPGVTPLSTRTSPAAEAMLSRTAEVGAAVAADVRVSVLLILDRDLRIRLAAGSRWERMGATRPRWSGGRCSTSSRRRPRRGPAHYEAVFAGEYAALRRHLRRGVPGDTVVPIPCDDGDDRRRDGARLATRATSCAPRGGPARARAPPGPAGRRRPARRARAAPRAARRADRRRLPRRRRGLCRSTRATCSSAPTATG